MRNFVSALRILLCALPIVLLCTASGRLMLPLAAAVFVHECAHLLALRLVGGRLRGFCAAPFGLRLEIDENTLLAGGEALVSAAGSAANLLCFLLSLLLYRFFKVDFLTFGIISLLSAGLNLLPAESLDGGRLLYLLLARHTDPLRASRITSGVSFVCALLIFLFSSYSMLTGGQGLYALLFSLYLLLVAARSAGVICPSKKRG